MTPHPAIGRAAFDEAGSDPLGVLASCATVVNHAQHVTIDRAAVVRLADDLADRQVPAPGWDESIHYRGEGPEATERTVGWIFALDALNFCFWGQGADPADRWRIASSDTVHDGYLALAVALRDAAQAGTPVWDPAWLAAVDEATIMDIFRPATDSAPIPLVAERAANLCELGRAMASPALGDRPFTAFVAHTGHSAPRLAQEIISTLPSFRDIAAWTSPDRHAPPIEVRFYKRAQILVADLAGALQRQVAFTDLEQLTAFADYKVPQVLRHHGILRYGDCLEAMVRARLHIPSGSAEEVEIRAATIWACELIRQALATRGHSFTASNVDWLLWNVGQALPPACEPYHRTVTIFY